MHTMLAKAQAITVLTGAGISAESGVPTFRGSGGMWNGLSAMDLATPQGFAANPARVWQWYNERRENLLSVKPNAGHHALVTLQQRAQRFTLITQNVDRLHQAAGSKDVIELHGNIWEVRCTQCGETSDRTGMKLEAEPRCTTCKSWLRPAVVWFGEALPHEAIAAGQAAAEACDVFLVVGTSAVVQPAAGLIAMAKASGAYVIEVNVEKTEATSFVDEHLRGKSGEILPTLL